MNSFVDESVARAARALEVVNSLHLWLAHEQVGSEPESDLKRCESGAAHNKAENPLALRDLPRS